MPELNSDVEAGDVPEPARRRLLERRDQTIERSHPIVGRIETFVGGSTEQGHGDLRLVTGPADVVDPERPVGSSLVQQRQLHLLRTRQQSSGRIRIVDQGHRDSGPDCSGGLLRQRRAGTTEESE